jgi:histidyl-tRNA synthetase
LNLARYRALLEEQGLGDFVRLDFSIVRGLAYYTGIVFELYDRRGQERAICGGGRYDDLIESLGGPKLEALGFGMGDVVLSLMLRERGLLPSPPPRVDVVVIPVGKELAGAARELTGLLRSNGLRVETPFSPAGVGKDLKAASRDRASFAVIVGPDEWSERSANLKNLSSGEERRVSIEALADAIRNA